MADPTFLDNFLGAETDDVRRRLVAAYRELIRGASGGNAADQMRLEMDKIFEAKKDAPSGADGS